MLPSLAQLPDTDIWLLDILNNHGDITFGNPVNITNRVGYDNQPAFSPDGKFILFSSVREGLQSDIYRYDIDSKKTTQVTKTEESEYSPTFMPDGKNMSVVRVERDSTQRLWKFPLAGGEPSLVLTKIKNVGYHCWIDNNRVALFILPEPFTLQIADVNSEALQLIDDSIGRCTQLVPNQNAVSYTKKDKEKKSTILHVNLDKTGKMNDLDVYMKNFKTPELSEDYVWLSPRTLLSGNGSELVMACIACRQDGWKVLMDLKPVGIEKIGRIVLSPDRKRIALVTTK